MLTEEKMKKIEEILNLAKNIYTASKREIRVEFYPSSNYKSVTLYDLVEGDDGFDVVLDFDSAISLLKGIVEEI